MEIKFVSSGTTIRQKGCTINILPSISPVMSPTSVTPMSPTPRQYTSFSLPTSPTSPTLISPISSIRQNTNRSTTSTTPLRSSNTSITSTSITSNTSQEDSDIEEIMFEDVNTKNYGKLKQKNILPDLDLLSLPENIKLEANDIYIKMNLFSKKSGKRKKLIFVCVYYAYSNLGSPGDPKTIAGLVGIDTKDINKAFNLIHGSDYRPEIKFYKPSDFIPEFCRACYLNKKNHVEVLQLAEEIWNKETDLNSSFPQVVAAAIIMYYLDIHGISYQVNVFSNLIKKADATLIIMKNRVAAAHNS